MRALIRQGARDRFPNAAPLAIEFKENMPHSNRSGLGVAYVHHQTSILADAMDEQIREVSTTGSQASLIDESNWWQNIPSIPDSTWNPDKVCPPGTASAMLDDIRNWIRMPSENAKIYFLADTPGSGKSTVAHSIGAWCSEQNILASSFFS